MAFDMESWTGNHPDVDSFTTLSCDLNGIFRGKRIPRWQADKVTSGGVKLALSTMGLDIWGEDAVASGMVFETGDTDGICTPTGRGPYEVKWGDKATAIVPMWMFSEDGSPHLADPRHALNAIVNKYKTAGLTPVCATELEFYLYDIDSEDYGPPKSPRSGRPMASNAIYALSTLADMEGFLNDIYVECEKMDVPADAAISEGGKGQFEINLYHTDDALKAADDAVLFKHIVKGVASKHGMGATFMAKPHGDRSGSGLHVHFSILDQDGKNIFDDGSDDGTDELRFAIGGLIDTMRDNTLIFAPHYNSYQRLQPDAHAPTKIAWGYENRTAALRIPNGPPTARRIEHRVSGADANPYLVIAAILGGALHGISDKIEPPKAVTGNAYADDTIASLPENWLESIRAFETANQQSDLYSADLVTMYLAAKKQEYDVFKATVSPYVRSVYIDTV